MLKSPPSCEDSNHLQQRRPTRFGSTAPTVTTCANTYELKQNDIKRRDWNAAQTVNTSTNRLKCSTIAKVPPAKSRLRPPVALSCVTSQKQHISEFTPSESNAHRPTSRLARPNSINSTRPTSLALKTTTPSLRPMNQAGSLLPSKICASILPKLSGVKTTTQQRITTEDGCDNNNNDKIRTKTPVTSLRKKISPTTPDRRTTTSLATTIPTTTKCIAAPATMRSIQQKSRLSGLKNLVALVHPSVQRSAASPQRVNSSATATTTQIQQQQRIVSATSNNSSSKLGHTASLLASKQMQATSLLLGVSRSESGQQRQQVNFNHKDVNGDGARSECKQDKGQQTVGGHAGREIKQQQCRSGWNQTWKCVETACNESLAQQQRRQQQQQVAARKDDQSTQSNNAATLNATNSHHLPLSVALATTMSSTHCASESDDHDNEADDELHYGGNEHGNNKQSNKQQTPILTTHLSVTLPQPTSANDHNQQLLPAPLVSDQLKLKQQQKREPANICYNHDDSAKSALAKSTASHLKRNTNGCAINDRILPKPMGQQVLSLMMLDVGLMPTSTTSGTNDDHSQQIASPKQSHVRIQSQASSVNIDESRFNTRSYFIDNNGHLTTSMSSNSKLIERNPAYGFSASNIDYRNNDDLFGSCRNNNSNIDNARLLEPNLDMMRLQLRLSQHQDNDTTISAGRSVSLPSSPRMSFRNRVSSNHLRNRDKCLTSATSRQLHANEHGNAFCSSSELLSNRSATGKMLRRRASDYCTIGSQPVSFNDDHGDNADTNPYDGEEARHLNENLLFLACDNRDSHSMTSSSCSSLNHHFPPLLSLSNQLASLRFGDLVKANVDSAPERSKQASPVTTATINAHHEINRQDTISASQNQLTQVARQDEFLTNDLIKQETDNHCSVGISVSEGSGSNKIDRAEACVTQKPLENLCIEKNCSRAQTTRESNGQPLCRISQLAQSNKVILADRNCSDYQLRRQQQLRSHSISGHHEIHLNGGYQRLKQSLYTQHPGNVFANHEGQYNHHNMHISGGNSNGRSHQMTSNPYLLQSQQQHHQILGRSPSPLSVNCTSTQYVQQRDGKYNSPDQTNTNPRSQLHASLECLNSAYSDYQQQQQLQLQQLQIQQHQIQQQQIHNQHYAASYVLAPQSPANTIINQSGDSTSAVASAMGGQPNHTQYHPITGPSPTPSVVTASSYNQQQTQTMMSRAMAAQVSQSPMRRIGLNAANSTIGASSGILNHSTNSSHHPIRAGHSSLSLASSSFIIEDKLQNEIRKLHTELKSEREKNEALSSQLNINSSLMSAFEQSLTTLNTRLRQLTTLNEKKDNEIEELREQLRSSNKLLSVGEQKSPSPSSRSYNDVEDIDKSTANSETGSERSELIKVIEDLKRQLIEKDRLLTDTRLEALSAAHQLEQLESKLNGEHSLLVNDDELDEGVMVANHSPSDSDAITDSAHFSEINSQISRSNQRSTTGGDGASFVSTNGNHNYRSINGIQNSGNNRSSMDPSNGSNRDNDNQSNHSGDSQTIRARDEQSLGKSISQQFNEGDSGAIGQLMDSLLLTS